jgi:hypothetical protein
MLSGKKHFNFYLCLLTKGIKAITLALLIAVAKDLWCLEQQRVFLLGNILNWLDMNFLKTSIFL